MGVTKFKTSYRTFYNISLKNWQKFHVSVDWCSNRAKNKTSIRSVPFLTEPRLDDILLVNLEEFFYVTRKLTDLDQVLKELRQEPKLALSQVGFQWLFLSAAIGQRPRNYLSCFCCCCSPFGSFPLYKKFKRKKFLPFWESNRGPLAPNRELYQLSYSITDTN